MTKDNMAKSFEISAVEKNKINPNQLTITYFPKQQTATPVIVGPSGEKPNVSNLINNYIGRLTHFDNDEGCWPRDAVKTLSTQTSTINIIRPIFCF